MSAHRRRLTWIIAGISVIVAIAAVAPIIRGAVAVPSEADVPYGAHPRQILDFYRAESEAPTPVLICFHGGGFVSGDKGKYSESKLIGRCLENGISVIAANYRFVRDRPSEPGAPFPAPMRDGARVVQFARSRAGSWNLDPERVVLTGGSAGACISIWLAVRDDMADLDSADPVSRLSTRVSGVISGSGQTTLDPRVILKEIGGSPKVHGVILDLYGASSMEELDTAEKRQLIEDASALNFVTADDPPLYLGYSLPLAGAPLPPETSTSVSIHHPVFGRMMCDAYKALGLDCTLRAADVLAGETEWEFLRRIVDKR